MMVALDAIAPGTRLRRLAEHAEEISFRIAARPLPVFHHLQDFIQAHDGGGLDVTALAEPGGEQRVRELLLRRSHLAERQTLALLGNVVPIEALVGVHREGGLRALLGRERRQERFGAIGHHRRSLKPRVCGTQQHDSDPDRQQTQRNGIHGRPP